MNTMETKNKPHRAILQSIAQRAMLERACSRLSRTRHPPNSTEHSGARSRQRRVRRASIRDLTDLLWASIDNDDSRDLDQLTVAETLPGDAVKIRVAVADVDALVKDGSAIDAHARHNTTSVYTAARIFPMLPEKLSTDLTSLNLDAGPPGRGRRNGDRRRRLGARVRTSTGRVSAIMRSSPITAWPPGWTEGPWCPKAIAAVNGLAENLREQDRIAQRLKNLRHVHGALSLETIQARPIFDGDHIRGLEVEEKNRATEIIEDFMIAANGVTARYLACEELPLHPPCRAHAETLGPDRRARPGARRQAAGDQPDSNGARRVSRQGASGRSAALPRPVPGGHQTPGSGRIRGGTPRRDGPRALRSRGQGLHPFHRPESPLPRSDHAALAEGRHRGRSGAL